MKLTFLGAAREVTGSCTLIEAGGHRFLVDCGMEQGKDVYPNADLPCAPGEIEAILLTHAHIDHSGRIPYLYKNGFRGPIYSTDATMDLCEIMLEDSAHIQEQEAEWKNRKAQRSGNELVEPDYTVEDAVAVMKQFVPQSYGKPLEVFPGITATFTDVGHLLGSASIDLPFLDWTRVKNNIKISEADYDIALIEFKDTLNQALNEVAYYYFAYDKSREIYANTAENYKNAAEITSYYESRYNNGKTEFRDFLEAINTENTTKKDMLQQKYQIIKYENYIYKAMAGRYTLR